MDVGICVVDGGGESELIVDCNVLNRVKEGGLGKI